MSYTLAYQGAEIDDILGRAAPGGALDTAIAAKQDALTFDAVPTQGSTNPAESGGIYDAIQAGGAAALAAFATDTVSGDVVSFPDGANGIPVKSFTGSITPVQDLHGQSAPYPAGGGKNKINSEATSATHNGVTYTVNADYTISTSGTATGGLSVKNIINGKTLAQSNLIEGASYVLNGCPSGGSASGYYLRLALTTSGGTTNYTDTGSGVSFTVPSGVTGVRIYIGVSVGVSANSLVFKPMIRLATEADATFAPYSNICPISGWTGANIYRMGANLWDGEWEQGRINYQTGQNEANTSEWRTKNYIPIKPNTSYYCYAATANKSINARFYDIDKNYIGYTAATGSVVTGAAFTTPANAYFMRYAPVTATLAAGSVSINYPSTATAYEAYNGSTILLSFGQTVYAGTLTALGGGLWQVQPTHAYRSITSADVFAKSANSQIPTGRAGYYLTTSNQWLATVQKSGGDGNPNGVSILSDVVYIGDTSANDVVPSQTFAVGIGVASGNTNLWFNVDATTCPDVASFKTYLDSLGMHICYPLADASLPAPITITASDLQTLLGANTVWLDCGAVTGMTYRADTALYIQKLLNGGGTLSTLSMASPFPSLSLGRVGVLAEPEEAEPEQTDEEAEQLEQTEEPEQAEEE